MYLAHHYPEQYDRCVLIGRSHVCRRCLVLYPLAIATLVLVVLVPPPSAGQAAIWLVAPVPALVELVLEQCGVVRYRAARQIAVTIPLAIGLGCGFGLYLEDHTSILFWAVVVVYTSVGAGASWWGRRRVTARSSV